MLADLAHELRTPIASIEATVEAIADGILPADAERLDHPDRPDRTGEPPRRGHRRGVPRRGTGAQHRRANTSHLGELANRAATGIQARYAAKGVNLVVDLGPRTPNVSVDSDRFAEALTNLLDNALRHTPPGGQVTLATGHTHRWDSDVARLTVTDTGEGFDPTEADRLFERFYRTDPARTPGAVGSGIGLTITKAILNAHHGTIAAHSDGPGRGATFDINLPTTAA